MVRLTLFPVTEICQIVLRADPSHVEQSERAYFYTDETSSPRQGKSTCLSVSCGRPEQGRHD